MILCHAKSSTHLANVSVRMLGERVCLIFSILLKVCKSSNYWKTKQCSIIASDLMLFVGGLSAHILFLSFLCI